MRSANGGEPVADTAASRLGDGKGGFPDRQRLDEVAAQVRAAVPVAGSLVAGLPPAGFVVPFDTADPFLGYRHIPDPVTSHCASLAQTHSPSALAGYLALILIELARSAEERFSACGLPEALRPLVARQLHRIANDIAAGRFDRYALDDDIWLKDFGICRLALLPCVTHLLWRQSGVPRRVLLRQQPATAVRALALLARSGGARPFLEGHTHLRMLDEFNEDGRRRCLTLVAALLDAWPDNRGLVGSSWYYDPAIATVSPRLGYLRSLAETGGALFLDNGGGPAAHGALSRSPTRRRLYEAGRYQPRNYLMIWARRDLLAHWG